MKETRDYLKGIGMPAGDLYDLPTSEKRFEDGGQYRFEVPGIQGPGPMKALLEALDNYGIQIHRVTQTQGIMRLLDSEIEQMLEYAQKWNVELLLATGPRATIDTSASVNTPEGVRMGYRLRGQEQIIRAVEDIKRAARIGVRSFMVYDEGQESGDHAAHCGDRGYTDMFLFLACSDSFQCHLASDDSYPDRWNIPCLPFIQGYGQKIYSGFAVCFRFCWLSAFGGLCVQ